MKTLFCTLALLTSTSLFAHAPATSNPPSYFQNQQKITTEGFNISVQRKSELGMRIFGSDLVKVTIYTGKGWDELATSGWNLKVASLTLPIDDSVPGSYVIACWEVKNSLGIRNSAEEGCSVIDLVDAPMGEKVSTPGIKVGEGKLQKAASGVGELTTEEQAVNPN